jgi:hypothetical protein
MELTFLAKLVRNLEKNSKNQYASAYSGCSPGKTFHVSSKWHPKVYDALVSIPEIGPGDTVWWHADLVSSGFQISPHSFKFQCLKSKYGTQHL